MTDVAPSGREKDPVRRQIGQNVRAELIRLGLHHDDLAKLLGISQPQVTKRIAGSIGFSAAEVARIASALDIPASRLMDVPPALLKPEPVDQAEPVEVGVA